MPSERSKPQGTEPRPPASADVSTNSSPGERRQKKALLGEPELRTMVGEQMQTLAHEMSQGKSQRLQEYLDFASRFHRYSRSNQFLIWLQRPTATQVASYRHWQDEGYQVAKGETGIRILAPSMRKRTNTETGEDERVVVGFVAVSVFDVDQLTPEKRPAPFFVPLEGDQEAFCARIIQAATADGFNVAEEDQTHGAEGYNRGRDIVTRWGLASVNRALTLLHEYAHGLLHQDHALAEERPLTRDLKECHAEATAYVVARHFGIENPFSADYLLQWGTTPERLREELDAVSKAASHIIQTLHAQEPGEGPRHDSEGMDE